MGVLDWSKIIYIKHALVARSSSRPVDQCAITVLRLPQLALRKQISEYIKQVSYSCLD